MTEKKETKKEEKKEDVQSFQNVYEVLSYVQKNLHAPKNQFNKFGNYNFRNCEDIQEGLKKVLPKGAVSYCTDDIVNIDGRFYVKATAFLCYGDNCVSNSAFAREPLNQKGMSDSQVTGAASSYARKYALGGLFMVDDQKDADSQDNSAKQEKPKQEAVKPVNNDEYEIILDGINSSKTKEEIEYAKANARSAWKRMDKEQRNNLTAAIGLVEDQLNDLEKAMEVEING